MSLASYHCSTPRYLVARRGFEHSIFQPKSWTETQRLMQHPRSRPSAGGDREEISREGGQERQRGWHPRRHESTKTLRSRRGSTGYGFFAGTRRLFRSESGEICVHLRITDSEWVSRQDAKWESFQSHPPLQKLSVNFVPSVDQKCDEISVNARLSVPPCLCGEIRGNLTRRGPRKAKGVASTTPRIHEDP